YHCLVTLALQLGKASLVIGRSKYDARERCGHHTSRKAGDAQKQRPQDLLESEKWHSGLPQSLRAYGSVVQFDKVERWREVASKLPGEAKSTQQIHRSRLVASGLHPARQRRLQGFVAAGFRGDPGGVRQLSVGRVSHRIRAERGP